MIDDAIFVKIIVVGDSGVGKTSILNQYCYNKFDETAYPTIGCDFCLKILDDFEGKSIRLQLWDIAGQDKYATVSKLYVKGALGCIIVSDITKEKSLEGALRWKEVIEENTDLIEGENIPIILLQNKLDAVDEQNKEEYQTMDYLKKFSKDNRFKACFQVSAKTDVKLTESIEVLLKEIFKLNAFEASRDNFSRSVISNQSVLKLDKRSVIESGNRASKNDSCGC